MWVCQKSYKYWLWCMARCLECSVNTELRGKINEQKQLSITAEDVFVTICQMKSVLGLKLHLTKTHLWAGNVWMYNVHAALKHQTDVFYNRFNLLDKANDNQYSQYQTKEQKKLHSHKLSFPKRSEDYWLISNQTQSSAAHLPQNWQIGGKLFLPYSWRWNIKLEFDGKVWLIFWFGIDDEILGNLCIANTRIW